MTRIRELATFMGAVAVAAVATLACSTESTILHVTNESAVTLESVVLSGSGFRVTAPDIPAGGSIDVLVSSRGESGLAVSFIAAGREVSMPEQGYFEGGGSYAGDVIIKPDLSVSVQFRLAAQAPGRIRNVRRVGQSPANLLVQVGPLKCDSPVS